MRYLETGPRQEAPRGLIDRISSFVKKSEQKRTLDELTLAFAQKAIADIQRDGFTQARRVDGNRDFTHQSLVGQVVLENAGRRYKVTMKSTVNKPGGRLDQAAIDLSAVDIIDLAQVTSGKKRHVRMSKDRIPGQNGIENSAFVQEVRREGHSAPFPYLSETKMDTADSITLLNELIGSTVDAQATVEAFEEVQREPHPRFMTHWQLADLYWNRERPGDVQGFFDNDGLKTPETVLLTI
jgi:hypothetical protein